MKHYQESWHGSFFNRKTPGNKRANVGLAFLVAATFCLATVSMLVQTAQAGNGKGKGKPGGGQDPPSLPNVGYALKWLDLGDWNTRAWDVNDSGYVVGFAWDPEQVEVNRAWAYVPSEGVFDLNDLQVAWFDLDEALDADPVTGWIACDAQEITENGQVVGTAMHSTTNAQRAYVLTSLEASGQFWLLPTTGADSEGWGVNDHGVIIAESAGSAIRYTPTATYPWYVAEDLGFPGYNTNINNAGVITSHTGYRFTPGSNGASDVVEYFPDHYFYALSNESPAWICGIRLRIKHRGQIVQAGGAFRISELHAPDDPVEILYPGDSEFALGINSSRDTCLHTASGPLVHTDIEDEATGQAYGLLALDDLLLNPDETWMDRQIWPWAISSRDSTTGFGQICGSAGSFRAFLLTPETYERN